MGIATGPGTPERTSEPRVAPSHQPIAVVLDLVNPVRAGRGLVGGRWEARFDEARPVRGKPRTHTLDQHAPNLGGRGAESNQPLQ